MFLRYIVTIIKCVFFLAQEKIPYYSMIGINSTVYYLINKFSEVNDDEKIDQWVKYVEIKIAGKMGEINLKSSLVEFFTLQNLHVGMNF